MEKKDKIVIGACALCMVLTLVIGFSYAYWTISKTQTDSNVITSGCLDLSLTNVTTGISLANQYPVSDEVGLTTSPYTFTIKNTCTISEDYTVFLDEDTTSTMSSSNIKASIDTTTQLLSAFTNADNMYTLVTGTLAPDAEKSYSLRMWMDEDTPIETGQNKTFTGKITVTGVTHQ